MAVALYNAGPGGIGAGVETIETPNCNCGGSNRAVLVLAQLDPTGSAPTNVSATWDSRGTQQAMTLIESWSSAGVYFYMFGVVNATAATAAAGISWTNACDVIAEVSAWTGVNQSSVAAAFTNAAHNNGMDASPTLTITSATGNIAVAHFNFYDDAFSSIYDTELYHNPAGWGGGPWESCGSYAAGAASVTLDMALSQSSWAAQGVNIVASDLSASALLAAAGNLAVAARITANARSTLAPAGVVAAAAAARSFASASFTPAGALSAQIFARRPAAADLASVAGLTASAHILGYFWDASATLAAAGSLAVNTLVTKPASSSLAIAGGLSADALSQYIVTALPEFSVAGSLAADTLVVIAPPLVQSVEERLHPEYSTHLATHINAQMELLLNSGTLVGRWSLDRGKAETISLSAPLRFVNGNLEIDIDELKALLGL